MTPKASLHHIYVCVHYDRYNTAFIVSVGVGVDVGVACFIRLGVHCVHNITAVLV